MSDDESPVTGVRTPPDGREGLPDPTFAIPVRPTRRYVSGGGLRYEGETVFTLAPDQPREEGTLVELIERVLVGGPYRYGDWMDLPMPLYLVHDDDTGDTFRVSVRDGTIQFHVLPETESAGLRALYERLDRASECTWTVHRRTG